MHFQPLQRSIPSLLLRAKSYSLYESNSIKVVGLENNLLLPIPFKSGTVSHWCNVEKASFNTRYSAIVAAKWQLTIYLVYRSVLSKWRIGLIVVNQFLIILFARGTTSSVLSKSQLLYSWETRLRSYCNCFMERDAINIKNSQELLL